MGGGRQEWAYPEQDKAAREIDKIEQMLRIDVGIEQPKSIIRASFESILQILRGKIPSGSEMISTFESIENRIRSRRPSRSFLSLMTRDLSGEKYLGIWIMKAIDRVIK